jgi:hypothetical protein
MTVSAGAVMALAGCGSSARHRKIPDAVADHDVLLLDGVLALERRAIAAYTAGIPLLVGVQREAATTFLRQELAHAGTLLAEVRNAGGAITERAQSYELGSPTGPRGVLELLHKVEQAEIAAYLAAIPNLSSGRLRAIAAAILADQAQHVVVLRAALGETPVPSPFVTGTE